MFNDQHLLTRQLRKQCARATFGAPPTTPQEQLRLYRWLVYSNKAVGGTFPTPESFESALALQLAQVRQLYRKAATTLAPSIHKALEDNLEVLKRMADDAALSVSIRRANHLREMFSDFMLNTEIEIGGKRSSYRFDLLRRRYDRQLQWAAHRASRLAGSYDEAYQLALEGLWHASKTWVYENPKCAKFITYAVWWLRRHTQIRKSADAAPGFWIQKSVAQVTVSPNVAAPDGTERSIFDTMQTGYTPPSAETQSSMDLATMLQKLSQAEKEAIKLTYIDKLTQQEAAEQMGLSMQAFKVLVRSARATLKNDPVVRNYAKDSGYAVEA